MYLEEYYHKADIELAMEDITDELKLLQEHLNTCSGRLPEQVKVKLRGH